MPFPLSVKATGRKLSKEYHNHNIKSKCSTIVSKLGSRRFFSLFKDRFKDKLIEIHDGYTSLDNWEIKILWKGKLVCKDSGPCGTLYNMFDAPGQPDLYIDIESGWIEYINTLYDPIIQKWDNEKKERTRERYNLKVATSKDDS